jgi:hypothetical protein
MLFGNNQNYHNYSVLLPILFIYETIITISFEDTNLTGYSADKFDNSIKKSNLAVSPHCFNSRMPQVLTFNIYI